jgi:hypothetical protein
MGGKGEKGNPLFLPGRAPVLSVCGIRTSYIKGSDFSIFPNIVQGRRRRLWYDFHIKLDGKKEQT